MEAQATAYAKAHGWMTKRHEKFPTTDLPHSVLPQLAGTFQGARGRIEAALREHCALGPHDTLVVNDMFVVMYTPEGQAGLKAHTDGSFLSFNIARSL